MVSADVGTENRKLPSPQIETTRRSGDASFTPRAPPRAQPRPGAPAPYRVPGRRRTKCSRTAPRLVTASSTTRSSGLSTSLRPARTSSGVSPPLGPPLGPPRGSERAAARRPSRTDRAVEPRPGAVTDSAPPARLGKIGCLPIRVVDRVEQLGERRRPVRLKTQVDGKAPQRHRDLGGLEIDLHDARAGRGFNSHRHPGHVAIDDEHQISRPECGLEGAGRPNAPSVVGRDVQRSALTALCDPDAGPFGQGRQRGERLRTPTGPRGDEQGTLRARQLATERVQVAHVQRRRGRNREAPNPPRGEVGRSHQHVARDREVTRARRRARRQLHGASDSPTEHARVDHLEGPFRVAAHDAGLVSHVLLPVDGVRAAAERPPVLTVGRATRHDDDARRVPEGVVHHGAEVLGPRVDVNEYALRAPGHLEVTVRYRQSDAFESRSGDGWNVRARLAERERRLLDRCRVGARIQEEVLDAVRAEKEKKMLGGRRRRYRPRTRRVVAGGRRWLLQAQR